MNETDQEQIESLKQFWAKWGTAVVAIVVLLAVLMIGTNVWDDTVRKNKETISDEYQLVVQLLSENAELDAQQIVTLTELSNGLKHKYSDSVYTAMASFNVAQQLIKVGELDKALAEYEFVIANANDIHSVEIALERKAKILLEKGEFDSAFSAITSIEATSMMFQFLGTQGDILVAQNKIDAAKVAYESAIVLGNEKNLPVDSLKLKLNDLSVTQ
ncbi:MAG: tetratricopeptide repeat protein [Saccharospirillaceae bacterium]|nr:tetratricopeptide repeat protein [Pseudomonadales bacterium]NRB79311.1 tetratricopeptide repeat protein [Saccharospirillaceae bacterium]